MQQTSYCMSARAIHHNIGTRPRACGPRARCQYSTYSPCTHAITSTYTCHTLVVQLVIPWSLRNGVPSLYTSACTLIVLSLSLAIGRDYYSHAIVTLPFPQQSHSHSLNCHTPIPSTVTIPLPQLSHSHSLNCHTPIPSTITLPFPQLSHSHSPKISTSSK